MLQLLLSLPSYTSNFFTLLNVDNCTHMVYFDSLETGAWFENELPQSTLQLEIKYRVLSGSIS
jgi:hypothetical protein